MTIHQLQHVVIMEALCLPLMLAVIVAAFKHWRVLLGIALFLTTVVFFYAWKPIMAAGSLLVYGPAVVLLWLAHDHRSRKTLRSACWIMLALGVAILIARNVFHIYGYLQ